MRTDLLCFSDWWAKNWTLNITDFHFSSVQFNLSLHHHLLLIICEGRSSGLRVILNDSNSLLFKTRSTVVMLIDFFDVFVNRAAKFCDENSGLRRELRKIKLFSRSVVFVGLLGRSFSLTSPVNWKVDHVFLTHFSSQSTLYAISLLEYCVCFFKLTIPIFFW